MESRSIASRTVDAGRSAGRVAVRRLAMLTSRFRAYPEVVIIGVKRGGTTSLFRDLERHRSMCPLVPSARRLPLRENMKGVHYFDTQFGRSERWYRSHFATRFVRARRAARTGASFTAEASPYYFFHPLAAERAAAVLPPTTRFVVLLRDPVERTVSHWSEQTRNGVEQLDLVEALRAEPERVGDAERQLASGNVETSHAHEQQTYVAQSRYAVSLRRWFDAVGRDRVTVLFSEDYYADPATTVRAITDVMGMLPAANDIGEHRNAASRPSKLDAQTEAELVAGFRSDVDDLAELLGTMPPWPRFGGRVAASPVPGTGRR